MFRNKLKNVQLQSNHVVEADKKRNIQLYKKKKCTSPVVAWHILDESYWYMELTTTIFTYKN